MEVKMPFLPTTASPLRDRSPARIRLHAEASGRLGDRRRLTFALSQPLVDQLGWQIGDRITIEIGVGEDLGAFRLSRSKPPGAGSKLLRNSAGGMRPEATGARVRTTLPPEMHGLRPAEMIDLAALPIWFEFRISGGTLDLTPPADVVWISMPRQPATISSVRAAS
jgi:hypothetical protein